MIVIAIRSLQEPHFGASPSHCAFQGKKEENDNGETGCEIDCHYQKLIQEKGPIRQMATYQTRIPLMHAILIAAVTLHLQTFSQHLQDYIEPKYGVR